MNINKKYAVFGVAAVIAVAGVIYFGTSANQQASIANVANKPSGPIVPISEPTVPTPVMSQLQWRRLCRDGKPHIQVLSPNGGEVYYSNQRIPIKWRSCNVSSGKMIHLSIKTFQDGTQVNIGSLYSDQTGTPNVPNTGSALSRVFSDIGGIQYNPGKNYKVLISLVDSTSGSTVYPYVSDESDNLFTINNNSWTVLCADGQPHIEVLSPNGGETYYAGQQINVKWRSCNMKPSDLVNILINVPSRDWDIGTVHDDVINDGSETITLPSTNTVSTLVYGNLFKVKIGSVSAGDISDNLFTIKDNSVQVDVCWNIPGIQTTVPSGMIRDTSGNCIAGGTTNPGGSGTTTTSWDTICADGRPHVQVLSPNGGQTYTAGDRMTVNWKTCNIRSNEMIEITVHASNLTGSLAANLGRTINDGSEKVTVPFTDLSNTPLNSGNYYRVNVYYGRDSSDYSDNTFTIINN